MPTILRITREGGHASAFARRAAADKPLCPTLGLLLLDRAGKAATKALRFAPRFTDLVRKTSEPGCQVDKDECDHGYRPVLTSRRLI
jgi:hypothetical protein